MQARQVVLCVVGLVALSASAAPGIQVGVSTKAQIRAMLGAPWRIVQFNDCGMAMPGQADETWDYRGSDSGGTYRLHIEFDDRGVARLVARIPDNVEGERGTPAQTM